MCAKYVPPHLRARSAADGEQSNGYGTNVVISHGAGTRNESDRPSNSRFASHWDDASASKTTGHCSGSYVGANSRFDSLRESSESRNYGGGCGSGGYRGARGGRSQGEGAWFSRPDGRRHGGWGENERLIFGERKATTGINFDEYDKIPVKITGKGVDDIIAMEAFSESKLCKPLLDNLWRCGYEKPTPVQKHAIPIVCEGRDVMACAQTGSGKTCAFMVPAIECLLRSGPPSQPCMPRGTRQTPAPCALVMSPTRELTSQIYDEGRKFAFNTGIRCCVVYGGADMRDQRRELNNGCDVLVATPGRLNDMFERGIVSLAYIQFLILDEADRMLDMGFEPQVRQIIDKTDMGCHAQRDRQSMMFSATFPREVQFMARDFLSDYVFLTVGRVGSASELVEQLVVHADDRDKVNVLRDVLEEHLPHDGLALVFTETKRGADALERDLWQDARGGVTTIHGDRSQHERETALSAFRSGRCPILIATDVASRGLDIPNVHLVVNYDMPKDIDDYVHRIGRTGRAGRKGKAVALVNDRLGRTLLRDLYDTLVESKQDVPDWFGDLCRMSRGGGGGSRKGKGKGKCKGGSGGGSGRRMSFGSHDIRADTGGVWRGSGGGSGCQDRGGDRW